MQWIGRHPATCCCWKHESHHGRGSTLGRRHPSAHVLLRSRQSFRSLAPLFSISLPIVLGPFHARPLCPEAVLDLVTLVVSEVRPRLLGRALPDQARPAIGGVCALSPPCSRLDQAPLDATPMTARARVSPRDVSRIAHSARLRQPRLQARSRRTLLSDIYRSSSAATISRLSPSNWSARP